MVVNDRTPYDPPQVEAKPGDVATEPPTSTPFESNDPRVEMFREAPTEPLKLKTNSTVPLPDKFLTWGADAMVAPVASTKVTDAVNPDPLIPDHR